MEKSKEKNNSKDKKQKNKSNDKLDEQTTEKVKETVNFGSVFEALYAEFITLEDLKTYLLHKKAENDKEKKKLCVAFRVLCMLSSSHFLENFVLQTENVDYIFLFAMSFHKYNLKIYQKIHTSFCKGDTEFNRTICGSKFDKEESEYIASVRIMKFVNKYSYGNIFGSDFLSLLKPEDKAKYYRNMIARCMHLNKNAPLYWAKVAAPLYRKFLEDNYKKPIFDKAETKILASYFPNLYSEKQINQPAIINRLTKMSRYHVAYRLGFPIHEYVPNEKKIEETLELLSDLGVKQYVERMNIVNKKINENIRVANTEDVNCVLIEEYNPFDVIHYYTDVDNKNEKHVFRFTRPEFPTLLKDQKNFYTGEILPAFIVVQIRTRLQIAGMYDLPPCQTLSELLGLREDGAEESEESEPDDILEIEDEQRELEQQEQAAINSRSNQNPRPNQNRRQNERVSQNHPPQVPHRGPNAPPPLEGNSDDDDDDEIEEVDEGELDDLDEDTVIFKARNEEGEILIFRLRMDDELRDLDEQELDLFIHDVCLERDLEFIGKYSCRCPECRDSIR